MQEGKRTRMNWVDGNFLQTLGIQPLAGRLFSDDFPADTNFRIVMNETAIKEIGFTSAAESIGKKVYFDWQGKNYGFDIIGVVKDFHFEDLHLPITPFGFQLNNNTQFNYLVVHTKPGAESNTLANIRAAWQHINPLEPFEFSFLDNDFQKNYEAENRLSSIVGYFTFIAILISCLGLFGLATFSAEQRTKEIGIRKVLGANVMGIITLLSKDFLKLVALAVLIASPLAWLIMNKWLRDFAYRIDISWVVFATTIGLSLTIAVFTISFQSVRAALMNPVKSLRSE
jgi:putative ABC transport system permease protein